MSNPRTIRVNGEDVIADLHLPELETMGSAMHLLSAMRWSKIAADMGRELALAKVRRDAWAAQARRTFAVELATTTKTGEVKPAADHVLEAAVLSDGGWAEHCGRVAQAQRDLEIAQANATLHQGLATLAAEQERLALMQAIRKQATQQGQKQ